MNILNRYKELRKHIRSSSNIYIIGHTGLDLDAIGSIIGIECFIENFKKETYVILDDINHEESVKKVLNKVKNNFNFIESSQIKENLNKKSLLIIVDTNKEKLISDNVINNFLNLVVIDHHDITEDSIKNGLIIVDNEASSTCEMITELIYNANIYITGDIATFLLAGIILDTTNFATKTTAKTYYCAAFLASKGAKPNQVQYFLKQDIKEYLKRQEVIEHNTIIKNKIAITLGLDQKFYQKEDLAKIADTLLMFEGIEASFVICNLKKDIVGISARSMGKIDVGNILKHIGGGGDVFNAATKKSNTTIKKVKEELMTLLTDNIKEDL